LKFKSFIENVSAKLYSNFKLKKYKKFMHVAPTPMPRREGRALGGYGAWGKDRGGLAHFQSLFAYFLT
jgi:hypothetical protein